MSEKTCSVLFRGILATLSIKNADPELVEFYRGFCQSVNQADEYTHMWFYNISEADQAIIDEVTTVLVEDGYEVLQIGVTNEQKR